MKIYDIVCPCGSHKFKSVGAETICQECGRALTDEEISKLLSQAYESRDLQD